MKKAGQFLFIFVPFLLVVGIQGAATFFSMGLSGLIAYSFPAASDAAGAVTVLNSLSNLWISQEFNTALMLVYAMITASVFGLWYYACYGGNYLPKPKSVFHPLSILGVVMLVPGMQYLSTYLVNFTAALFPHWLETYEELLETAGLNEKLTVGLFFYSILLAPLAEELVFRGVTMRQAKKCLPFWAANFVQAFLFGVFHMNMIQGIYAFCLGLLLGYVCEKSGSIYNSILLHLLFNLWGTVLNQYFYIGETSFAYLFWFLFGLAMTAGGLLVFRTGTKKLTVPDTAQGI